MVAWCQTLFLPYLDYHRLYCSCCCGTYTHCHRLLHVTVAPFHLKFWRMTGCWLSLFCYVLLLLERYSQTTDIELKPPTKTRRITRCELFNEYVIDLENQGAWSPVQKSNESWLKPLKPSHWKLPPRFLQRWRWLLATRVLFGFVPVGSHLVAWSMMTFHLHFQCFCCFRSFEMSGWKSKELWNAQAKCSAEVSSKRLWFSPVEWINGAPRQSWI